MRQMTNTEKPTTKAESKKLAVETPKKQKMEAPKVVDKPKVKEDEPSTTPQKSSEQKGEDKTKKDAKPETKKPEAKQKPKPSPKRAAKKEEVVVNGRSLPISTKYSVAICRFIKGKKIDRAIDELEQVAAKKKSVPMKGEYAHKKGSGKVASGSGKYPKKASEIFIVLLKSLNANAINHDVNEPIITDAVANIAQRPFARFGRWRKKRSHVTIKAREKRVVKKKKKSSKKKVGGKK